MRYYLYFHQLVKINSLLFFFLTSCLCACTQIKTVAKLCEESIGTPSVHCGSVPSGIFDKTGRYWLVFEYQQTVYSTYSDDLGHSYSNAVAINKTPEVIYTDGENRPKIALGPNQEIYVTWTQKTKGNYTGNIRFSRSTDLGKTFEPIKTINDDGLLTGHRFDTLLVNQKGEIFITWLDKRDREAAKQQGHTYNGIALYYTVSIDNGVSFTKNRKITDNSCECCRLSICESKQNSIAIFWRYIFGKNTRDHAFVLIDRDKIIKKVQRATRDDWNIDACPHHGPSMIFDEKHHHMVWFTNSETRKGIYYGRYNLDSNGMENVKAISTVAGASHPFIAYNESTHEFNIVWKSFDGYKTTISLIKSDDLGNTWQSEKVIADTEGASDHPMIINNNGLHILSWQTENEGYRLFPITVESSTAQR